MKKEKLKLNDRVYIKTNMYSGWATVTSLPRKWGGSFLQKLSICPHGVRNERFVGVKTDRAYQNKDGFEKNMIGVCVHQIADLTPISKEEKPVKNDERRVPDKEKRDQAPSDDLWGDIPGGRPF